MRLRQKGTRASQTATSRRKKGPGFFTILMGRFKKTLRLVLIGGVIVWLLIWAGMAGVYSGLMDGVQNRFAQMMAGYGFVVENVRIQGRHYTSEQDIVAALSVVTGQPLFSVDLQGMRDRLGELEWVERASIRRLWPDQIIVTVFERQPLAIWREAETSKPLLLDRQGTVMFVPVGDFSGELLRVSGVGAPLALPDLVRLLLAQPDMAQWITKADRIGERRWNLHLVNGAIVKLPEDDVGFALSRLAAFLEDKDHEAPIAEIDLRLNDRMIVTDE